MEDERRYCVVVDAGSSGSRAFLYEMSLVDGGMVMTGRPVSKVSPGLSTFEHAPETAADYVRPLLEAAASHIPQEQHEHTSVFIKSTAGMRLVEEDKQEAIYDIIYKELKEGPHGFKFKVERHHVGTIDGHMEAYYAVLSTNYLEGRIDARLHRTGHHQGVLGALDMGGESTQIMFPPGELADFALNLSAEARAGLAGVGPVESVQEAAAAAAAALVAGAVAAAECSGDTVGDVLATTSVPQLQHGEESMADDTCESCGKSRDEGGQEEEERPEGFELVASAEAGKALVNRITGALASRIAAPFANSQCAATDKPQRVSPDDFWGNSFLSFGVGAIQERVWTFLVDKHIAEGKAAEVPVVNPCAFVEHTDEWMGHVLVGSGDALECAEGMKHMIWGDGHMHCEEGRCDIDGVDVPVVTGDFYAMSVFFYGMDCVRELERHQLDGFGANLDSVWPTPSVGELQTAVEGFCSMEWGHLNSTLLHVHAFTPPSRIPYRCVEAVYMTTLLRHGYGFPEATRNITFAREANGMEVEWTLGFALAEVAASHHLHDAGPLLLDPLEALLSESAFLRVKNVHAWDTLPQVLLLLVLGVLGALVSRLYSKRSSSRDREGERAGGEDKGGCSSVSADAAAAAADAAATGPSGKSKFL